MAKTSVAMIEEMDEALAMLWYQVDRIGNRGLREEIEEVADGFMTPGEGDVERAHRVFRRAHEQYTPETQVRFGLRLVRCPHCEREEAPDE